jgi:hypothetical protein
MNFGFSWKQFQNTPLKRVQKKCSQRVEYLSRSTSTHGTTTIIRQKSISIVRKEKRPKSRMLVIVEPKLTKNTSAVVIDVTNMELTELCTVYWSMYSSDFRLTSGSLSSRKWNFVLAHRQLSMNMNMSSQAKPINKNVVIKLMNGKNEIRKTIL